MHLQQIIDQIDGELVRLVTVRTILPSSPQPTPDQSAKLLSGYALSQELSAHGSTDAE